MLDKKDRLISLKENFLGIDGITAEIFKIFSLQKDDDEEKIFQNFLQESDRKENLQLAFDLETSGSEKNLEIAARIKDFYSQPILKKFSSYKSAFFTSEDKPRKIYGKNSSALEVTADKQRALITKFTEKINSCHIANDTAALLDFVDKILTNYSQQKERASLLDYNDLITKTNRLLANPDFSEWVKMKMDSSFDHILIDESQDTNHEQWSIIKALSDDFFSGLGASSKDRSIFIVGDEKQSIFSFQGSEANISTEIFSYFEKKLGGNLKKIELNNSFRSVETILAAVDKIFSDPHRSNAISKTGKFQSHVTIRSGAGIVEIWPQIKLQKERETKKNYEWKIDFLRTKESDEQEILAEIIATKIRNWVDKKRLISAKNRPVDYRDIMILLRNRTNGFSEKLVRFFHQYQIPFSSITRLKFSESLLIQDLLSAAKFVLLPHDDLNLACLLKSPIFGIDEEKLLEICVEKNSAGSSIYDVLEKSKIGIILNELIEKSKELSCFNFFYFLLRDRNCQKDFLHHFGSEGLSIIDKFLLLVLEFCNNSSPNLQKFLEFADKADPEILLSDVENDCVKITTAHSAKGLQAPIVIIPDCCYETKKLPSGKEKISWLDDLPLLCLRKSNENSLIRIIRNNKFEKAKEEYLRLLYVAMTRAEDELYIGGFGNSSDPESWYEIIRNSLPDKVLSEENFAEKLEEEKFSEATVDTANQAKITELYDQKVLLGSLKISPISNHKKTDKLSIKNHSNPAQIRGKLIHKILEIFGKNYPEDKTWLLDITKKIIAKEENLSNDSKNQIFDLTANFLASEQFEKIFRGNVKCEVEITADKISGRIDLLAEQENEILIIDYKSDETVPKAIPDQYAAQLTTYKNIVEKIYPAKKISCAILWIKSLQISFLSGFQEEQF